MRAERAERAGAESAPHGRHVSAALVGSVGVGNPVWRNPGIWDCVTNQQAVSFVRSRMGEGMPLGVICEQVRAVQCRCRCRSLSGRAVRPLCDCALDAEDEAADWDGCALACAAVFLFSRLTR